MKAAKKRKNRNAAASAYTGELSPTKNGAVTVISKDKLIVAVGGTSPQETFDMLNKALGKQGYGPCSTAEQLRIFKKYVPKLMGMYCACHEMLCAAAKNEERLYSATAERSRKRWTADEDEVLIELASRDDTSLTEIAVTMGRTPGAITSRITELVGVSRLSQDIAGRFVGTIDGEHVQGYIDGSVTKG